MKQWEDWIIFLGFYGNQYDNTMSIVKMWNDLLAESGLTKTNLNKLSKWLFDRSYARIWHSCCLGFKSMHESGGYVEADWVDGGGLTSLPAEYNKVKDTEFSDSFNDYDIRDLRVQFFNDYDFHVIGMTLNGNIVIDTFKKFGHKEDMKRRMQELGDRDYCKEFIETVKENYNKSLLPVVPKGILKLSI